MNLLNHSTSKRKNQMQRRASLEFIFRSHLIVRPVHPYQRKHTNIWLAPFCFFFLFWSLFVLYPFFPFKPPPCLFFLFFFLFLFLPHNLIFITRSKAKKSKRKKGGMDGCGGGEEGQTFVSHQISTSAARVEYPLFLQHVPLCATPIYTPHVYEQTKISILFFFPPNSFFFLFFFSFASWRDIYKNLSFRGGVWQTLYSGSMSSSISFPVKVRTLAPGGVGLVI